MCHRWRRHPPQCTRPGNCSASPWSSLSWPARLRRPQADDVPDTIKQETTRGHHPTTGDGLFAMSTRKSAAITEGPSRAPARAMLKAVGFTDADLRRPIIGVANTWIEIGPCNYHLRDLAEEVKAGIRAAGGTPMEFNTVSISDGITMGSEGMKASLVSREVVADSIELVARGKPLRRHRDPGRLRQDDSRRGDGAGAARHSRPGALWRVDSSRKLGGTRRYHPGRVRGRSAPTRRAG